MALPPYLLQQLYVSLMLGIPDLLYLLFEALSLFWQHEVLTYSTRKEALVQSTCAISGIFPFHGGQSHFSASISDAAQSHTPLKRKKEVFPPTQATSLFLRTVFFLDKLPALLICILRFAAFPHRKPHLGDEH